MGTDRDKVKKKKQKRRKLKERNELHKKVLDAKAILDYQGKERMESKGKEKPRQKICTRILPVVGIYRNGARGKEVKKSVNPSNTDKARLESDVFSLVERPQSRTEQSPEAEDLGDKLDTSLEAKRIFQELQEYVSDDTEEELQAKDEPSENVHQVLEQAGPSKKHPEETSAPSGPYAQLGCMLEKVFADMHLPDEEGEEENLLLKLKAKVRNVYQESYLNRCPHGTVMDSGVSADYVAGVDDTRHSSIAMGTDEGTSTVTVRTSASAVPNCTFPKGISANLDSLVNPTNGSILSQKCSKQSGDFSLGLFTTQPSKPFLFGSDACPWKSQQQLGGEAHVVVGNKGERCSIQMEHAEPRKGALKKSLSQPTQSADVDPPVQDNCKACFSSLAKRSKDHQHRHIPTHRQRYSRIYKTTKRRVNIRQKVQLWTPESKVLPASAETPVEVTQTYHQGMRQGTCRHACPFLRCECGGESDGNSPPLHFTQNDSAISIPVDDYSPEQKSKNDCKQPCCCDQRDNHAEKCQNTKSVFCNAHETVLPRQNSRSYNFIICNKVNPRAKSPVQPSRRICGEHESTITERVQNMRLQREDKEEPQVYGDRHRHMAHCNVGETAAPGNKNYYRQPVKYIAFENGLKTKRVPIYPSGSPERSETSPDVILVPQVRKREKIVPHRNIECCSRPSRHHLQLHCSHIDFQDKVSHRTTSKSCQTSPVVDNCEKCVLCKHFFNTQVHNARK